MKVTKKATQEQINEILKLGKELNLPSFTMTDLSYERAERIIAETKANWGE